MEKYINHANHNYTFHESIQECFPDHYFDWKVTCIFYVALHYMRAYIKSKGVDPGSSHNEIDQIINPARKGKLPVTKTCWENYRNLYEYSRVARYDGFIDVEAFLNERKIEHMYSGQHLEEIKSYLKDHGLKI
jgi:uncharacterized protein (UPF0332 family)